MKSVFVSGGAGFIGSHLVRRLLRTGDVKRVVVFDNFSSGREEYLREPLADGRLQVVRGDLKEPAQIRSALTGADTVFHLAANPDIARAATEPDIDFREGSLLMQNMLEAMRLVGAKNLIYTSGSGVYGDHAGVEFREDHGPCIPISTYGASKLACEALIAAYAHMFGMRARVFRFANVVGPRQTHGVGFDFVHRLAADPARLRILGDGTQSKSYIHVDDILDAMFLAWPQGDRCYDVFNVATGDYMTVREIAALAVEVLGLERSRVRFEFTGGDRGWNGDVPVVRFDCSRMASLGWRCKRTSAEAMRDAMMEMRGAHA